ncbi:MAG TPA: DUF2666 domain-containing protein, partial [Thermococcus litoralis]|nr:DUF2666 domain-containing protein [Thermococcus litoralis]
IKALVEKLTNIPIERYAPKEFAEHGKLYALRTALQKMGLSIDISSKSLEKYLEKV